MKIEELRARHAEAVKRLHAAAAAIQEAGDDADVDVLDTELRDAEEAVKTSDAAIVRFERAQKAREEHPVVETPAEPEARTDARVTKNEPVYRPDQGSYFRDLFMASKRGDFEAAERLRRSREEVRDHAERELVNHIGKRTEAVYRDLASDNDTKGADFIPPLYMANLWIPVDRPGRPFANVVGRMPLPPTGDTITLPKLDSGTAVAVQVGDGSTIQETDATTSTVTNYVETIAGMQDLSLQLVERSFPGMDTVIMQDLVAAYDTYLDTQLISGLGHATYSQHLGIRAVSSINTSTYTATTPAQTELLPKLYDALQKIASNRYLPATHFVMHPRRAHWLASGVSTSSPVFLQSGFSERVSGGQDQGYVMNVAGLPVVQDANMATTYGAGTNQDEVIAIRSSDVLLAEGALRTAVDTEVLGGNLQVRFRIFAYSAFISNRYPKSISVISGTGLATPSF